MADGFPSCIPPPPGGPLDHPVWRRPIRCYSRTSHTKGCFVRRLRIGILDLVAKGPSKALWGKLMNANLASIMPQIIAVWCEEEGHEVHFVCYTGAEDLLTELPRDLDMVFISAFSQ